jgi:hypothetical protein
VSFGKRSLAREDKPFQAPKKRNITVPVLSVVLAIGAAVVGRVVGQETYDLFLRPAAAAPTAAELDMKFAELAKGVKATLPKRLDDVTTLTDIAYANRHMTYVYHLDTRGKSAEAVMPAVRKLVTARACGSGFKQALRQGYVFTFRYRDTTGGDLGEFSLSGSDCG